MKTVYVVLKVYLNYPERFDREDIVSIHELADNAREVASRLEKDPDRPDTVTYTVKGFLLHP